MHYNILYYDSPFLNLNIILTNYTQHDKMTPWS